jgi:hypothetical protein
MNLTRPQQIYISLGATAEIKIVEGVVLYQLHPLDKVSIIAIAAFGMNLMKLLSPSQIKAVEEELEKFHGRKET